MEMREFGGVGMRASVIGFDAQRSYARGSLATVQSRAQRRNWNRADTTEPARTRLAAVTR
ncbi:MAG TPA: hypothetical protein VH353_04690 [Caulobacteraceae bacterium]|jgi:hypothetical protein|nr:hypothetical protein [Caulobacteraceae bacterium]